MFAQLCCYPLYCNPPESVYSICYNNKKHFSNFHELNLLFAITILLLRVQYTFNNGVVLPKTCVSWEGVFINSLNLRKCA